MNTTDAIESHHVTQRRADHCHKPNHGPFESLLWALKKPSPAPFCAPFWSKCPVCDREIQHEQDEEQAKARGTTNEAVRTRRLLGEAGVGQRFLSATLGNYNTALPKQKNALQWAKNYAYHFATVLETGRSHAVIGTQGTGKTHLAVAILRVVLQKGGTARYVNCSDMLARFKASFATKATESSDHVFRTYTTCDLLVIDEVGRHGDTNYDREQLFRVLNTRHADQKPTLIVSNMPQKEFVDMMGLTLLDRMREGGGGKVVMEFESQRGLDHERSDVE